jgi:hypothetical protein
MYPIEILYEVSMLRKILTQSGEMKIPQKNSDLFG